MFWRGLALVELLDNANDVAGDTNAGTGGLILADKSEHKNGLGNVQRLYNAIASRIALKWPSVVGYHTD